MKELLAKKTTEQWVGVRACKRLDLRKVLQQERREIRSQRYIQKKYPGCKAT